MLHKGKYENAIGLSEMGYIYPPHAIALKDQNFLTYFSRQLDKILLRPVIENNLIDITFLEACGLYSGVANKNFTHLGLFCTSNFHPIALKYIKKNFPQNVVNTFEDGYRVPKFDELIASPIAKLKLHREISQNENFLISWCRYHRITFRVKSLDDLEKYLREEMSDVNRAIQDNDIHALRSIASRERILPADINFSHIQSSEMIETLFQIQPMLKNYIDIDKLTIIILKSGRIDMLNKLLEKRPDTLDVTKWNAYLSFAEKHIYDMPNVALELTRDIVHAALRSDSFPVIQKVFERINLSFGDPLKERYEDAKALWIRFAFETQDKRIIEYILNKISVDDKDVIVRESFLSGNPEIVRSMISKYGKPKNWKRALSAAILSKSFELVNLCLANIQKILPLDIRTFFQKALLSSIGILRRIIEIVIENDFVKEIEPQLKDIRHFFMQDDGPYFHIDVEKIRVYLEKLKPKILNGNKLLLDCTKDTTNSPIALYEVVKYFGNENIDWNLLLDSAQSVNNYRIEWWIRDQK